MLLTNARMLANTGYQSFHFIIMYFFQLFISKSLKTNQSVFFNRNYLSKMNSLEQNDLQSNYLPEHMIKYIGVCIF